MFSANGGSGEGGGDGDGIDGGLVRGREGGAGGEHGAGGSGGRGGGVGGADGGGGDGPAMNSCPIVGVLIPVISTPSCEERVPVDVACSMAAASFAADALAMIIRALTLTLAAVTVRVTSSAAGKRLRREVRIVASRKDVTSPAAVKSILTTERKIDPGL